jgi:hypothetical protein
MDLTTDGVKNKKFGNVGVRVEERRFWRLHSILIASKIMRFAGKMHGVPHAYLILYTIFCFNIFRRDKCLASYT